MTLDEAIKICEEDAKLTWNGKPTVAAEECQQMAEWLKDYKRLLGAIEDIKAEIKEWYWQADKQAIAKDPCVVDAMVDLFIRTINKHISGGAE